MRIITKEYENSEPQTRFAPMAHGQILGERGGFYSVKIIDDYFDVIVAEYKNGERYNEK